MAKFTINRLLETSKFIQTEAGSQLSDFIDYVATFSEQTLRGLRNNLSFGDNFACIIKTVDVVHNTDTLILTDGTSPTGILVTRVISAVYGVDSFAWWLNDSGQTVVRVGFSGAPTEALKVRLVILTA
jgi:hypothetical protein